ncbi:MAG TPA: hypothetical protein VI893_10225 [Thermoplasmata archaeon]|nr:hypothetical protein [Thermoplasmata archaeon]
MLPEKKVVGQKVEEARELMLKSPGLANDYSASYLASFTAAIESGLGICAEAYAAARAGALLSGLGESAEFAGGYAAGTFGQARAAELALMDEGDPQAVDRAAVVATHRIADQSAAASLALAGNENASKRAFEGVAASADFDSIDEDVDVAEATTSAVAANGEAKLAGLGEAARHAAGAVAFAAYQMRRKEGLDTELSAQAAGLAGATMIAAEEKRVRS